MTIVFFFFDTTMTMTAAKNFSHTSITREFLETNFHVTFPSMLGI